MKKGLVLVNHSPHKERDTLIFNGQPIAINGAGSVAGVLMAADITSWRTTRHVGNPRGVFCCMGMCYDCLVSVDGHPNQRACLVPPRPGMIIESTPLSIGPDSAGDDQSGEDHD